MAVSGARCWGFICPQISTLTAKKLRGAVGVPWRKISVSHAPKDLRWLELCGTSQGLLWPPGCLWPTWTPRARVKLSTGQGNR